MSRRWNSFFVAVLMFEAALAHSDEACQRLPNGDVVNVQNSIGGQNVEFLINIGRIRLAGTARYRRDNDTGYYQNRESPDKGEWYKVALEQGKLTTAVLFDQHYRAISWALVGEKRDTASLFITLQEYKSPKDPPKRTVTRLLDQEGNIQEIDGRSAQAISYSISDPQLRFSTSSSDSKVQFQRIGGPPLNAALFAFIVNFGVGSYLAAVLMRRNIAVERLLAATLALSGLSCAVYPALIHAAMQAGFPLVSPYSAGSIAALMLATAILLAPLLIPAGLVFPLAWSFVRRSATQGEALSSVAACNKFGSALGAFAGSFVLFPAIGMPKSMAICGALYLALSLVTLWRLDTPSRRRRMWIGTSSGGLIAACAIFATVPAPVSICEPNKLVASYQGADGVVAVSEDQNGSRHIIVNNSYVLNGTERALRSQKQECWLPLALCENPRRASFIGMASGISAAAALDFSLEHLDAIELVPEVVRAAKENFGKWNARLFSDPRASIRINDGRCVIQSAAEAYDLIICDLMFKEHEGTSSLYSREFFSAARAKLSAQGRFCLWLPLYQLDQRLTGTVIRTFLDIFPNAIAMRGNLDPLQPTMALIGAGEPIDLSSEFLSRQLERDDLRALSSECAFFRSVSNFRLTLVGDLRSVAAEFDRFPLNTDDAPIFAFEGPRVIPDGETLRGFTFLNAFGKRFLKPDYPSCSLGSTPPEELLAGIRAGNHVFAASVSAVDLPTDAEKQLGRARQTMEHLQLAGRISPHAEVKHGDLGH